MTIEQQVEKWIKEQHGSAGWEQKLVSFCERIYEAGYADGYSEHR